MGRVRDGKMAFDSVTCGGGNGTHASALAWKIPGTGEPSGLAAHGDAKSRTSNTTERLHFHFHALEKEMAPTPVLLPGESQGRGSLVGCRLWRRTESDTTEATQQQQQCRLYSPQGATCARHRTHRKRSVNNA